MKTKIKKWMSIMLVMSALTLLPRSAFATDVSTQATENSGTVTVSGAVTDSIAGQGIAILIVENNVSLSTLTPLDIVYVDQTEPDNSGNYSFTFTMPADKRTGTYDVYVGATAVSTPAQTDLTFPTAAPTVDMGTAKPAVNGANAFYYFITITLNDGTATGFTVKHYPTEKTESVAETQDFGLQNISNTTIKVISVLKAIPDKEANTSVTSKATLTYTIGGVAGEPVVDTKSTTLNTTKGN